MFAARWLPPNASSTSRCSNMILLEVGAGQCEDFLHSTCIGSTFALSVSGQWQLSIHAHSLCQWGFSCEHNSRHHANSCKLCLQKTNALQNGIRHQCLPPSLACRDSVHPLSVCGWRIQEARCGFSYAEILCGENPRSRDPSAKNSSPLQAGMFVRKLPSANQRVSHLLTHLLGGGYLAILFLCIIYSASALFPASNLQHLIDFYKGAGFYLLHPSSVVHGADQWYEVGVDYDR